MKQVLDGGTKGAKKAAEAYKFLVASYGTSPVTLQAVANVKILEELAKDLEGKLAKCGEAFNTKRTGVEASWYWLVRFQEYVRAITGEVPDHSQLTHLVKAMRHALGLKSEGDDVQGKPYVDPILIRKGVQQCRKRNPLAIQLMQKQFFPL